MNGVRVTGRLADLSPTRMALLVSKDRRELGQTDVVTVKRHMHASLGTGAKWGFGVGATFGLLASLGISSECRGCGAFVPIMTAMYGGLGAGVGVGIASLTPTKSVVYRVGF